MYKFSTYYFCYVFRDLSFIGLVCGCIFVFKRIRTMAKEGSYEEFVEKFKPKKTTDDCYTPPEVYQCVLDYVGTLIPLEDMRIERPFYPGGDYKKAAESYDVRTIVIDNPPFSILSEIKNFYLDRGIWFFLFAPHLTLFSGAGLSDRITYIICSAQIIYANGALVGTSFVCNFLPDVQLMTASTLKHRIEQTQRKEREEKGVLLPKYRYPVNVITPTTFDSALRMGVDVQFLRKECAYIRALDCQKSTGKSIFGNGFLVSEEAGRRAEEARRRAERGVVVWELSEREREIIRGLG